MNRNLVAAVVAIAIVAVAAAAVLLSEGNDTKNESPVNEDTSAFSGLVYGNANGDGIIDEKDSKLISDIIEGKAKASDYPLADANRDGKIDETDRTIVDNIIDGVYTAENPTELWVKDGRGNISQVTYPVNGIFTSGGTNMRVLIQVLGLEDQLAANATNDYISDYLDHELYQLRQNGIVKTVTTGATTGDWTVLFGTQFTLAILENSGMSGYINDKAVKTWNEKGVDTLVFDVDDYDKLKISLSTVGILTGTETAAAEYIEMMESTVAKIKDTLGDRFGTATMMNIVMSNSVSGTEADYYKASEMAGGKNLADWPETTRAFNKGDTWLFEEKYNPQYLIHIKSMAYGKVPSAIEISNYKSYFDETAAYKSGNYYLINGTVPLPVRLALMATIMYPDSFDSDWAYGLFQEYFDKYSGYNDGKTAEDAGYWDVRSYKIMWSTEELENI